MFDPHFYRVHTRMTHNIYRVSSEESYTSLLDLINLFGRHKLVHNVKCRFRRVFVHPFVDYEQ